jgi:Holliday junction resolvasome RuvABC endonuclease subunit
MPDDGFVVLGLDPSAGKNSGWAVVKLDGDVAVLLHRSCHRSAREQNDIASLGDCYDICQGLIDEFGASALAVERSAGGGMKFVRDKLSESVGVVKLCCHRNGVAVHEISPAHLKKEVCGHGRAGKPSIKANVRATFGLGPRTGSEHELDAAAMALCLLVDLGWKGYEVKAPYQKPGGTAPRKGRKKVNLKPVTIED